MSEEQENHSLHKNPKDIVPKSPIARLGQLDNSGIISSTFVLILPLLLRKCLSIAFIMFYSFGTFHILILTTTASRIVTLKVLLVTS